jgi:predicted MPP superfamily phosphohydrolase
MLAVSVAFWMIGLLGHAELWILYWNFVESSGHPRFVRRRQGVLGVVCFLVILPALLIYGRATLVSDIATGSATPSQWVCLVYLGICGFLALIVTPKVLIHRYLVIRNSPLHSSHAQTHYCGHLLGARPSHDLLARMLLRVPGNQSLQIEQNEKHVELANLPGRLDGLTIAHISDLHLTGRVGKAYFERVVELTNSLDADVIALTGDLIDKEPYLCWLPGILGRLQAPAGVFFVLGNHDLRVDVRRLRLTLSEAGLIGVGGRWTQLTLSDTSIVVAGNELPWIDPVPDMTNCLSFARQHGFDLMLAGHTHGGQIRLPGIGAIVCPCRGPVAHAAGVIAAAPTVMHVSRGISAELPIRLYCRPEVTKLVLRCSSGPAAAVPVRSGSRQTSLADQPAQRTA